MRIEGVDLEKFRSLLFYLAEAREWTLQKDQVTEDQNSPAYTLLWVAEGNCSLYADDRLIPAPEQSCYILPPCQSWYIGNYSGDSVRVYRVGFKLIDAVSERVYAEPLCPVHYNWRLFPYSRGAKLIEQLAAAQSGPGEGMAWFKRRQSFMELIGMLLEHNSAEGGATGSLAAAERSVRYIEEHYGLPLNMKQLAERAGAAPAQHAAMIKQLTGFPPLDYLHQIRIKHAKELLVATDDPLREIARKIGYEDEYYFNRRFRQIAGIAPRQYAQLMRGSKRIRDDAGREVAIPLRPRRILYFGEVAGDLLALGIRPIACNLYGTESSWLTEEEGGLDGIEDIGIPFRLGKARRLEPDLIIFSNMDERIYEEISDIAPTIVYNSHVSLKDRITKLGEWLDKREEAARVVDRYRILLERAAGSLKAHMREGETVSVFICHRGRRWFVMGRLGLSELLYTLDPAVLSEPVRRMADAGEAYRMIAKQEMAKYAGDVVIVPMPHNAPSREATEQLLGSEQWRQIPAVANGRAFVVEESKWNFYDAISRLRQLEELSFLWNGSEREDAAKKPRR